MSIQAVAWVFDEHPASGGDRLVLLALANHYSRDGICFVSYDTIAREARMSRRAAIDAVNRLEQAGYIGVSRPGDTDHRWPCNSYTLSGFPPVENGPAAVDNPAVTGGEPVDDGSEGTSPRPVLGVKDGPSTGEVHAPSGEAGFTRTYNQEQPEPGDVAQRVEAATRIRAIRDQLRTGPAAPESESAHPPPEMTDEQRSDRRARNAQWAKRVEPDMVVEGPSAPELDPAGPAAPGPAAQD